ncbi:MAG: bifunctional serine/threonine-protein kinase/formylglycine-generating enzyme family protein [Acidobacteriales bacterium]|nr:bifunctional serine/threonine-protein kinase/formylglycine-generating enzyme family protein [Terriglobales bacterium]
MTPQAGVLIVLVCPECGKRYKGDPTKPDARYQCPADQSTLIKLDSGAEAALRRRKEEEYPPQNLEGSSFDQEAPAPTAPPNAPQEDLKTRLSRGTPGSGRSAAVAAAPAPAPGSLSQAPIGLSESGLLTGFGERRSVVATIEWPSGTDPEGGPIRKYEKKNTIGKGGMGEVLKVLDRDLRREVAMKMLRPQREGMVSAEDVFRFMKEAQATGRLEHPNIIPVHDLGVDGQGRIYFTLKYVQGVSLKEAIKGRNENGTLENGRRFREVFNARHMIDIFISVCQGVAYAHSKGIIHRDLKPENVMLGKFGEVLVMDWGLAKVLSRGKSTQAQASGEAALDLSLRPTLDSSMTLEGDIAGTPSYMSPEQAAGKNSELDERTDVYSLGAMLYEILSGEPPFTGPTALEIIQQVSEGKAPATVSGTCDFRPVPRELRAICEKAMQHDPNARYQSVEALRDDVQAYMESRPVSSCPDTLVQKTVKFIKRNRHRVTTMATTAAAIVALIFGSWFIYWQITVHRLLTHAESEVALGRSYYVAFQSGKIKVNEDDPVQATILATAGGDYADFYRQKLNSAIDSAREVLEIFPRHERARSFLADSYMEIWRMARDQNNPVMMSVARGEVERYAEGNEKLLAELNGFGKLDIALDPPEADAYLFSFETMHGFDRNGNALPERMVPVPYDPVKRQPDTSFLTAERKRSRDGEPLGANAHSIFRLDPTSASRLGTGKISLSGLPPGSYLLLLMSLGLQETRIPIRMDRMDLIQRTVEIPRSGAVPPGFIYVASSRPILGGDAANAFPRNIQPVGAFVIAQEEVSMADYSEFLRFLVRSGKAAEARNRMPRENGNALATIAGNGELSSRDGGDQETFLASPVRGVSYQDTLAYAEWRSRRDRVQYRLPNEVEWETACRGTDGRLFAWGNKPAPGVAIASLSGNNDWNWQNYKDESPLGAHNMSGSVAEWTASTFDPRKAGEHTVRGNALSLPPAGLACPFRSPADPDSTRATIGFRLAADWPLKAASGAELPDFEEKPKEKPKPLILPSPPQPEKPKSKAEEAIRKLGLDR